MKRLACLMFLLLFVTMGLYSATATVIALRGTVSVQRYSGGPWVRARKFMKIYRSGTISTGYGASVVLRIVPSWTTIRLNQFTTASIYKLTSRRRRVSTSLRLRYGSVRAVVKSSLKLRSRFRISTPVATASVRGTIPEVSHFPGIGTTIKYIKGSGFVISRRGKILLLARGQRSRTSKGKRSSTPFQEVSGLKSVNVQVNLTPAERDIILKGVTGRFSGSGIQLPQNIRNFLRQVRLINLLGIKPQML